jgi:hypothetical protein
MRYLSPDPRKVKNARTRANRRGRGVHVFRPPMRKEKPPCVFPRRS